MNICEHMIQQCFSQFLLWGLVFLEFSLKFEHVLYLNMLEQYVHHRCWFVLLHFFRTPDRPKSNNEARGEGESGRKTLPSA